MHEDINVQIINMDVKIPEQVTKNQDGSYTIFLNARFSQEYRAQAYQHALKHIQNGDFDREDGNVQVIELVTHDLQPAIPPHILQEKQPDTTVKLRRRKRKRRSECLQEQYMRDRLNFILEHCDSFAIAEHEYLYGKDL